MINPLITKQRIANKYKSDYSNSYYYNYYLTMTSLFSFRKNGLQEIAVISSNDCELNRLFFKADNRFYRHELSQMIENIMRGLMEYGRVYLELETEYEKAGTENKRLKAIQPKIIYGEIRGAQKSNYILYSPDYYTGEVRQIKVAKNQIVIFDLKDIGLKRKYFREALRKIGKCDITKTTTALIENTKEYDYEFHSRKADLLMLKATKEIGYVFKYEEISDSYILYRKLKQDKLKLKILDYIIDRLNNGLLLCAGKTAKDDSFGSVELNIKRLEYDKLWKQYSEGKITTTQLNSIIFN